MLPTWMSKRLQGLTSTPVASLRYSASLFLLFCLTFITSSWNLASLANCFSWVSWSRCDGQSSPIFSL